MRFSIFISFLFLFGCTENTTPGNRDLIPAQGVQSDAAQPKLNQASAELLLSLPLKCTEQEYPNKLSQTLAGDEDLLSPT